MFTAAEGFEEFAESVPDMSEPGVTKWSASEMSYTFPAAFESYTDGRHDDLCPSNLRGGCWQEAVIPVMECQLLHVRIGYFTDWNAAYADLNETLTFDSVGAAEVVPVVYGDERYEVGYITDVVCVDY